MRGFAALLPLPQAGGGANSPGHALHHHRHFKPALFRCVFLFAQSFRLCHQFGEAIRVARVQRSIGHFGFRRCDQRVDFGDAFGQQVVIALVLIGQFYLRRHSAGGNRGGTGRYLRYLCLGSPVAFCHPVGITTGDNIDFSGPIKTERQRHGPVEEITVMANDQHGAVIVGDDLLQQIERFQIEVIGRFVKHQQIGLTREFAREQNARALAAGQGRDPRFDQFRVEQEFLEIALNMLFHAANHDPVAAIGKHIADLFVAFEQLALLVDNDAGQRFGKCDFAAVGLALAGQHPDQRGLARPVRADNTNPVTALDSKREVLDDRPVAKRLLNILGVDDRLGLAVVIRCRQFNCPLRPHHCRPRRTHFPEFRQPPLIALAPCCYAAFKPVRLDLQFRIHPVGVARILGINAFGPRVIAAKTDLTAPQKPSIKPECLFGQSRQKCPVMANDHERAFVTHQPLFEPFDCGKVEMVSWFVQQQQIGLARERAADRGAAAFATRRGSSLAGKVDAKLVSDCVDFMFRRSTLAVDRVFQQCCERFEIGVLFEHYDVGAGDHNSLALVGLDRARNQLHQRRLASAIATDQCQPVARPDEQVDVLKQPPTALLQREFFISKDRRLRHGPARIGGGGVKGKGVDRRAIMREATNMRTIYLNSQYLPEHEGKVSVFDRGFLFSDSVYEVVSVLDGKLVDFDGHVRRLARSLGELGIKPAPETSEWLTICRELVNRNAVNEGMIYWQVTRGAPADRDFAFPPADTVPTILAFTQSRALVDTPSARTGIKVVTLPDLRWGRADIKTTQLLYASLMKNEAIAQGADDAWMTRDGFVTEGTAQNAHIVTKDGVLVTHPLTRDILHGITRAAVLPLVSLAIEERAFTVNEAENSDEAFVSSASGFVMPVVSINGKSVGNGTPGPITKSLRASYIEWARSTAI